MSRLRVPTTDRAVLAIPSFDALPALVEENRRRLNRDDIQIGGLPLRELRALARREVLELARSSSAEEGFDVDAPLLLAGHQPELSHPGVWVKNFALNGLAKKIGGIPLNLIVDNDTLKSTSLHVPVIPDRGPKVHSESVAFDTFSGEVPYEDRKIEDASVFRTFAERVAPLSANWGFETLLAHCWASGGRESSVESETTGDSRPPLAQNIGETFTAMRTNREEAWGCKNLELLVSLLFWSEGYARFVAHILADLSRFAGVYNSAILKYRTANGIKSRNHPAPELQQRAKDIEAPFWMRWYGQDRRTRFWVWRNDNQLHFSNGTHIAADTNRFVHEWPEFSESGTRLSPRALTLTLFARVCLGDFFIHGIGGGKYDEVTDDIIRNYFGIEPPAYQVLSATLRLPLPTLPSTPDDLKRAERRVRDLHWNPQRHLVPEQLARPEVQWLLTRKNTLIANEPPLTDHTARKAWFRELQAVTIELRHFVWKQPTIAKSDLTRIRAEVAANEVLQRRDYSWVLYPEETLRPFLQRFLNL
ncbi:MAG: hypothetical protein C0467_09295 [Planctomycetaceae bacterium]|nr:hypothetical protein [Planctomycetaceae bacterium]